MMAKVSARIGTKWLREAALFLLPMAERDAEALVDAYRGVEDGDEGKKLAAEQMARVRLIRSMLRPEETPMERAVREAEPVTIHEIARRARERAE
jgi:hypothetical protein